MATEASTAPTRQGPFESGPISRQAGPVEAGERDARFDNAPPLEERIMLEFLEDLDREGIKARIAELLESAAKAPKCDSEAIAGKIGDFVRQASDVEKRLNAAREKHNRPLLNGQRALKGKADEILAPLLKAGGDLRAGLNHFMAEQARLAREEAERRRLEAEEARAATAEVAPELAEQIHAEPVAKPVARGELGSRVGTRTVWKFEREVEIKRLPKAILENERVVAAVDQVIGQMIRGGTRKIAGVRIWDEQEAAVR